MIDAHDVTAWAAWLEQVTTAWAQEYDPPWSSAQADAARKALQQLAEQDHATGIALAYEYAQTLIEMSAAGQLPDDAQALAASLEADAQLSADAADLELSWWDLAVAGAGQLVDTAASIGGTVDNTAEAAENAAGSAAENPGWTRAAMVGLVGLGVGVWAWAKGRR